MSISIVIAEDDALLRTFLLEVLKREPDFEVLTGASDGKQCLEAVRAHQPRMLLLDLHLPELSGLKVLEALVDLEEPPLVLVLSGDESERTQMEAARMGARGFVAKSGGGAMLPEAIRAVAQGEVWFSRQLCALISEEHARLVRKVRQQERPLNQLSEKELEVLVGIVRGLTNKEIARDLFMSIHTVKLHIQNILRKLNLPNRTEAAVFAVREGLLGVDVQQGAVRE